MKYIVFKTSSGKYGVKKEDGVRAIKTFDDEKEAKEYAEEMTNKANKTVKKDNKKTTSKNKSSTKQSDDLITKEVKKQTKKAKRKIKKFIITIIILLVASLLSFVFYKYIYPMLPISSSSSFNPSEANIGTIYEDFQIHFMQIGNNKNGDAIYIKAGDNDILIDAGASNTSTIKNYMNKYVKDNKLEYVIVTHSDEDHLEGIVGTKANPGILDSYEIDTLIDFNYVVKETQLYKNYVEKRDNLVSENKIKHLTAAECLDNGNKDEASYDLGNGISMNILYNKFYFEPSKNNNNDHSVVTLFKYNNHNFLLTGDLEEDGEKAFVEHYKNKNFPNVDLYKAGHHGSKTSSNGDFLSLIKPSICVASCSAGNPEYTNNYLNVFPTQDFVTRISKYTNQVFATSYGMDSEEKPLNGNIIVSCDGNSTAVACSNNVTLLKDTEWFNSKIYVKEDNTFTPGKTNKTYYTKDTEGVKEVPFRIWG